MIQNTAAKPTPAPCAEAGGARRPTRSAWEGKRAARGAGVPGPLLARSEGILVTRFGFFETPSRRRGRTSERGGVSFVRPLPVPVPARVPLALAALVLLAGCTRRADTIPSDALLEDAPTQETWDVTLSLSVGDRPRAVVRAPYLARFERADSAFARFGPATPGDGARVSTQLYDDKGAPSATVASDRLLYFDAERRFVAEGRVVVQTETGKTLRSEQLTWDEADRSLRTDGFVQITTPDERLQGYRLTADEDLETYTLARITGQVTVGE